MTGPTSSTIPGRQGIRTLSVVREGELIRLGYSRKISWKRWSLSWTLKNEHMFGRRQEGFQAKEIEYVPVGFFRETHFNLDLRNNLLPLQLSSLPPPPPPKK